MEEMEDKNIKSGERFHWLKLSIAETLMSGLLNAGTKKQQLDTLGRFIYLSMYYLKSETVLTYKKASYLIEKRFLERLIELEDVVKDGDLIKIPSANKNWKTFCSTKEAQSRGGKKTQEKRRKLKEAEDSIDVEIDEEDIF